MDSIIIIIVISLLIANLIAIILLLKRQQPEQVDNSQFFKDEVNSLKNSSNRPLVIIANTIKGKGISFMENKVLWHYKPPNDHELKLGLEELNK